MSDSKEKEKEEMKRLYAIRDKKTGEFENRFRMTRGKQKFILAFVDKEQAQRVKQQTEEEVVTLRIEPTEPCEFCKNPKNLLIIFICEENYDENVWVGQELEPNLCPMCGRRLKDD